MLDLKHLQMRLLRGVKGRGIVALRETNFGYAIRCEMPDGTNDLRDRAAVFALVSLVVAALGVWFLPFEGFPAMLNLAFSVVMLALGYITFALLRSEPRGIELHVDTKRRELRSAALMPNGEAWIRGAARFGEVDRVELRDPAPDEEAHSLVLKLIGRAEPMPVAVGAGHMLRSVQARLIGDLSPLEVKLAARMPRPTRGDTGSPRVFPEIGPQDYA